MGHGQGVRVDCLVGRRLPFSIRENVWQSGLRRKAKSQERKKIPIEMHFTRSFGDCTPNVFAGRVRANSDKRPSASDESPIASIALHYLLMDSINT